MTGQQWFLCGCHDALHGLVLPCAAPESAGWIATRQKSKQIKAGDVASGHIYQNQAGLREDYPSIQACDRKGNNDQILNID